MRIYEFSSYRKIIKNLVEQKKSVIPEFNFQRLAELTRIQKTYLSKVINGNAELNRDQCYAISVAFSLDDDETEYFLLVNDHNRTSIKERQLNLEKKMKDWQVRQLDSQRVLKKTRNLVSGDSTRYYLFPEHMLVHVALGIKKYAQDTSLLYQALDMMSSQRISEILLALEAMGIIQLKGKQATVLIEDLHLHKSNLIYKPWFEIIRHRSLERINHLPPDDSFAFSAVFTCSHESAQKMKSRTLSFIQELKELSENGLSETMFQVNLDLFPWLKT